MEMQTMRFFPPRKTRNRSPDRPRRNKARPLLERLEDRSLRSTGLLLGSVTTSLTSRNDIAYGLAIQSDGKILAAGTSNAPGSDGWASNTTSYFALVRYNADLTLDTTFGSGGSQTTAMNSLRANQAQAIAVQPADGKSVLAGWTSAGSKSSAHDIFAVARYTTSGALDTSFGSGKGYVTTDVAGTRKSSGIDRAEAVAIDANGNIVVAGWGKNGTYEGFALARYTSSGALDTTFNSHGSLPGTVVSYPIANSDSHATSVVIQPDGKIVVAGNQGIGSGNSVVLERYNADGTLDTTFGSGGIVVASLGTASDTLTGLALDASGNIVAVGQGANASVLSLSFLVARFTPTGSLDTSFNGTGYVITGVNDALGVNGANAVTIESNGDIAAAGSAPAPDTYDQTAIVEYTSSGALDTTFNGTGIFTHEFTSGGHSVDAPANAIRLNSAGNFVVAGLSGNYASSQNPDFLVAVVDPPAGGSTSTGAVAASCAFDSIVPLLHPGLPANLALALPPGAPILPAPITSWSSLNGSFQATPSANSFPAPPTLAAVGETRVGSRSEAYSGGGDEDAIDQVFIDWQSDGSYDAAAAELQIW
jgi:uncharacterized delta-60 repeat protein